MFKLRWKASRLGPYFDIDILAKALATSIKDASMMSAALAGTFSFVGGLLFRGLAIMARREIGASSRDHPRSPEASGTPKGALDLPRHVPLLCGPACRGPATPAEPGR